MTCSTATGVPEILRPCSALAVLVVAASLLVASHGTSTAKTWLAGSLQVEAQDYRWGQLISLKGAVENGDPFRAARIMVEAGQPPDPFVYAPALNGLQAAHLGS